ncbi:FHA domain-containing protein [Pacificoceanicola onchidii]|uniref:FHA domain-containing protein n=1 Tax=Pacificoceanicola onchidii TaxID=2562685 RepID=UPI0010A4C1B3|nr:FHA domain-containing protein [Pacificoceanicola onchidii]
MSSFRNIIARRRPSVEPEPAPPETSDDAAFDPGQIADLIEDIGPSEHPVRDGDPLRDQPRAELEAPRWEVAPPPPTMGESLLKSEPQADSAPATPPEQKVSRRRIWDMENNAAAPDTPEEAPQDSDPLLLTPDISAPEIPAPIATSPAAPAKPVPARGGRVKTRLLGFHSEDAAGDLFSTERAGKTSASVTCPVGWLVVVDGPGRGASFALSQGLSTLGRSADQSVPLDFGDDAISRDNHASIAYDEEENTILIGHGGKSNLVRLNGKPLVSTTALSNGDEIRLGKTTLRFVALCGPDFSWTGDESGEDADG